MRDYRKFCSNPKKCRVCPPFAQCEGRRIYCEDGYILSTDICVPNDTDAITVTQAINRVRDLLKKQTGQYICKTSSKDWFAYGDIQGELYALVGSNPNRQTIINKSIEWLNHSNSIQTRLFDTTVLYSSLDFTKSTICQAKSSARSGFIAVLIFTPIVFTLIYWYQKSQEEEALKRQAKLHAQTLIKFLKQVKKEMKEDVLHQIIYDIDDKFPWPLVQAMLNKAPSVTYRGIGNTVYYSLRDTSLHIY